MFNILGYILLNYLSTDTDIQKEIRHAHVRMYVMLCFKLCGKKVENASLKAFTQTSSAVTCGYNIDLFE